MRELSAEDLARCRRGDRRGLEALYLAHADRIYRTCLNFLGQPADAEDATHDVLLRVFAKIGRFAGRSRLSTWIYKIAVHHCLNQRRRPRPDPLDGELLAASGPTPIEASSAADDRAHLLNQLQRLGAAQRAVLVLREIEGLTYGEIAEVLGVPVGTVMSRLARARRRLAWILPASDTTHNPARRNGVCR